MAEKPRRLVFADQEQGVEGSWASSYSDMITNLLVFFVIISAMAPKPSGDSPTKGRANQAQLENVAKVLSKQHASRDIQFNLTQSGLEIVMKSHLLFGSAESGLASTSQRHLRKLLLSLKALPSSYAFAVEGHTDDEPIHSAGIQSNWHLSALRALALSQLLVASGIPSSRVWLEAYGPERPLLPNRSSVGQPIAENQQANRRAVIRVVKWSDGEKPK